MSLLAYICYFVRDRPSAIPQQKRIKLYLDMIYVNIYQFGYNLYYRYWTKYFWWITMIYYFHINLINEEYWMHHNRTSDVKDIFVGCFATWYNNVIQKCLTVYLLRFDMFLNIWHYIYFGSSCMTLKCYPLNCQGSYHTPLVYRRQFIKEAFLIAFI